AIGVALVVGLSVVTSTMVASRAYQQRGRQAAARAEEITVRGAARRPITSDLAGWRIRGRGRGGESAGGGAGGGGAGGGGGGGEVPGGERVCSGGGRGVGDGDRDPVQAG